MPAITHFITTILAALFTLVPLSESRLHAGPQHAVGVDQERALIRQMLEERLTARVVPRPMSSSRLADIAGVLEFDEKSVEAWSSMVEKYQQDWNRLGAPGAGQARRLKSAVYDWDERSLRFRPRPVSDLALLDETTLMLREVIRQLDQDLLENLEMLASRDQIGTAREIIHRRAIERDRRPSTIPGSQVDLTRLIGKLEIDVATAEALEALGDAYRSEFREAIGTHARLVDRDLRLHSIELVELGPLPENDVEGIVIDVVDSDRSSRRAEILEAEIALQDLNREYIGRARSMLPPGPSLKLLRAWQESLGGDYLREQTRLVDLIDDIITDTDLDDRSKQAALSIPEEIISRNEPLDARILEQETMIDAFTEVPRSAQRDARLLSMRAEVLGSNVKRRKNLINGIQTLLGVLSSDTPAMTRRLVAFEAELRARNASDIELIERSVARSTSIENRLAREAMEEEIRRTLEARSEQAEAENTPEGITEKP